MWAEKSTALKAEGKTAAEVRAVIATPNISAVNALFKAAMTHLKDSHPELVTKLISSVEKWKGLPVKPATFLQESVPHFKIAKMYSGEYKRMEFHISPARHAQLPTAAECMSPQDAVMAIVQAVSKDTGVHKLEGLAPPGDLERKIQETIDLENPK